VTPAEVVTRLAAEGIRLEGDGAKIIARPSSALTDRHRALIRQHMPSLLALLTRTATEPEATTPRRLWSIRAPDGTAWEASFHPAQSLAVVMAWYSGAVVEPVPDPDPRRPLPPDVADLVNGWLNRIGEACPQTRAEALELARTRPSVQEIYRSMVGVAAPPDLGQAAERFTVRCSSCVHFQPSEPDPSGFGSCVVNAPASRREGTLWPNAEHNCHDHHEVSP